MAVAACVTTAVPTSLPPGLSVFYLGSRSQDRHPMDYETTLNQALDAIVDGEDRKAQRLLQGIIDHLKAHLTGTDEDLTRYYYWGRCQTAMEEYEQALLKFEKALGIDPDHEGSLWETASIFLHDLDLPESAKNILSEKLVKRFPGNTTYSEALHEAEFLLRIRKSPPPPEVPEEPA
jgi:tetratricopeptide (TPR) repeat protein